MDTKAIKSLLKESKEAIKNKDFKLALKSCKAVLKVDRNNYVALVLLGASLQDSDAKDQAPNAFRKAIEVSPEQILAWQGLSSFYEKDGTEKHALELIPVYRRLLELESDCNKWCEIIRRLEPLLIKTQNAEVLGDIINEYLLVDNLEKQQTLQVLLRNCLSEIVVPEHLSSLVKFGRLLRVAISTINSGECRMYFNLLYKQKLYITLIQSAMEFSQRCPDDVFAREWICKIFTEQFVENRPAMIEYKNLIPEHIEILLRNGTYNVVALMAQGVIHVINDNFIEAREVLKQCLSMDKNQYHGACLLSQVHMKLLNYTEAEKCAEAAFNLNPSNSKTALMLLIKSLAFSDRVDNWKRVVELSRDHLNLNDSALIECLARAYLKLEDWTEFGQAVSILQCDSSYDAVTGLLEAEAKAKRGEAELLDNLFILAETYPDNAEIMFKLGLQCEEKKDYQNSYTMFIKAAKLAPHWYKIYLQLGYHYSQYMQDYDKARRCYQKAFQLDPDSDETGIALSDTFKMLGDVTNNLTLLEVISKSRNAKWAWLRLGLQHLEIGDSTAAINSLRAALRTDPNHSHLWETLADAYLSRGAYTAALKSYEKVAELRPGAFYPKLQIATIKQVTDLLEESLIEFRELLESDPRSVLALKGLSETCLSLAKSFLERRLLGLAKDRLQEGLTAIANALSERDDIACLWKIVGDITTLSSQLPRSMSSLEVPQILRSPNQTELVYGVNLLQLGARCYVRALRQMGEKESSSFVWHDLAFNYRLQAMYSTETKENQALSEKALACAKKSVVLASYRWQHWNLLGIIAVMPGLKNYALAQHAFIKAVEADDTTPTPWSNLGTLYFMLRNVKLANNAFKYAQRVEPAFRQSWIGQALIAETVNHEETMDLFRHTTELGFHPESCMGYAQWVCSTLQSSEMKNNPHYIYSIENMHALPVAIDSLTWATDFEEDNACGLNMLGCLFERCGQYINSVKVLNRAIQHTSPEHKDIVRGNLARVLLKSDNIQNAIKVYKSITKADFHSQCGLALALFKGDQLEESFTTYESSLHWMVPDDAARSHLLVAMAAVSYKLSGVEKAKTLLFQCIQKIAPKSVHGLFAACALGMLNNDLVLSKAALKELEPFQDDANYISHIAVFQAYVTYIQGQYRESVWSLSKTLHRQPWHASLWLNLALMLLQSHSVSSGKHHSASAAARCAQSAMALGRNTIDVSKILSVVSLSHLIVGDWKLALSASQHAVHLFPAVGESWAVLAASCHSCSEPTQLRLLLSHARQNLDLQRPLSKWMSNFERKIALVT